MKKGSGFTLIELMVIVAILGIVIVFGIPRLGGILESNRNVTHANSLVSYLSYARSEAVKRGTDVSVTPTVAGDWLTGWTVAVVNPAQDLRTSAAPKLDATVTMTGPAAVTFRADGSVTASATILFCLGSVDTTAMATNISPTGAIKPAKDIDANDIVNDVNGVDVNCP